MATIKTIKPAGGGDYTTLQAWEDWADGEAAADQHAECYVGDLGSISLTGWTSTPDATNHPKIYAATGNQHDGTNTPSGAKIVSSGLCFYAVDFLYIEVIGIYFDWYDATFGAACVNVGQGSATTQVFRFDRCVFDREHGSRNNNVIEATCNGFNVNSNSTHRVTNCVFYNKGSPGGNTIIYGASTSDQGRTILWELINNTAPGLATDVPYGFYFSYQPNNTVTVVLMNNAIYGPTTACFAHANIDTSSGGYNASSDATADDLVATGALTNRTAATDFVSSTSSPEIDPAGGLDGAGTDGSAYTTVDIRGQTRSVPWNIGAWQDAAAELGFPIMGTSALQLFINV